MAKDTMNRWLVIVGAIMIQLVLGVIFSWAVFTTPLQGTTMNPSQYGFTKTQTQLILSTGLATFAVVMILAGSLQQTIAPRTVALGGTLLGVGYISAGYTGSSFLGKLLSIGLVGGIGIGLAYVVPIAIGAKWFPDKRGLISGIVVSGFGFGSFIWQILASPPSILGISGLIKTDEGIYTISNLDSVFTTYGIIFLIMIVIGSLVMIDPPEGYMPPTDASPNTSRKKKQAPSRRDYSPAEMLKTWQFYAIWSMFAFGALAGLMVIGNVQNFARNLREGFQGYGFTASQAADFAAIGAAICLPILNGIGRIVWGMASDRMGNRKSLLLMFLLQGIMMLSFFFTTTNQYLFYLVAAFIGFNFGGNFALFPATTADFFGRKNLGANYGIVFASYGVGGIVGPILAGMVQDYGLSFMYAFLPASGLCFVAALLASFSRAPEDSQSLQLAGSARTSLTSVTAEAPHTL
ncbi:MAG: OFA family MFS transporter [archaeon]